MKHRKIQIHKFNMIHFNCLRYFLRHLKNLVLRFYPQLGAKNEAFILPKAFRAIKIEVLRRELETHSEFISKLIRAKETVHRRGTEIEY